ncbi:MAG: hypothetical protein QW035_01540 [Candidatus Anstonellales archaeon]
MRATIALLLVGMLMLYGCTLPGGGNQTGGSENKDIGGLFGGNTGQGRGGSTGGSGAGGSGSGSAGGQDQFSTWDLEAFAAMGAPIKCTVRYRFEGGETYVEMYMKGKDIRMDGYTISQGEKVDFSEVLKNNQKDLYLHMGETMPIGNKNCYWLYYNLEEMKTEASSDESDVGGVDMDMPPVEYKCEKAAFGDEKFATPGEVCDMSALMKAAQSGSQAAYCEYLTGQDKIDCLKALGH